MDIIDKISKMTDAELRQLKENAKAKLDKKPDDATALQVLNSIDSELEKRYIPGMIKTFKDSYPDGFYGEKQAEEERNDKVAACEEFRNLLSKAEFSQLIEDSNLDEIVARVATLINKTNFIQGSFEKPIFLDTVKSKPEAYCHALYQCLWGEDPIDQRLESFISSLENLKLRKWTYFSYFLFLQDPENMMFVKPEMLKRSLAISRYSLDYDPKPTVSLYFEILEFSRWLKAKIDELKPRDMIDVHSFMWHMAPTGKWSDT